jgi:D-glycero-D-manno-heptose 1,7-bisphosphate phosphatase
VSGRAIFLDRDGTLVKPRHYPSRPADLELYPAVAPELRRLQRAGFQLVVITNQSGIARSLFTEADLDRMHRHLNRQLAHRGVRLNAIYHCPHHPEGSVPELSFRCACRKPEAGMLVRAATDLEIDCSSSWVVGDILDDIQAGRRAGCRTVLVDLGSEQPPSGLERRPDFVARSTAHALRIIARQEGLLSHVQVDYWPARWALQVEPLIQVGGVHGAA